MHTADRTLVTGGRSMFYHYDLDHPDRHNEYYLPLDFTSQTLSLGPPCTGNGREPFPDYRDRMVNRHLFFISVRRVRNAYVIFYPHLSKVSQDKTRRKNIKSSLAREYITYCVSGRYYVTHTEYNNM